MPTPKNASHPSTRSSSPSASPNEVTTLLPPPTRSGHSSGAHSPAARSHAGSSFTFRQNRDRDAAGTAGSGTGHARKGSVGGRSVSMAGSVRGHGTIPRDRGPIDQVPRASKLGQRRILTTWPIRISFSILFLLTLLSAVLVVLLFVNTGVDLSVIALPFRGSGFGEFWISAVGLWIGLGGLLSFSHPSYLYFLTTLLTFLLLLPLFLLSFISKPLRHAHYPFFGIPLGLSAGVLSFTLLSNFLVRRAKRNESRRILRMLNTSAVPGEGADEERTARALVGLQGGFWGRIVGGVRGILGLIAGMAGMGVVLLLLADMSISAYDASIALPSPYSKLVQIQPAGAHWPIDIHMACIPPSSNSSTYNKVAKSETPLVIMYEPPSGVPGSLALLTEPIAPDGPDAVYPGQWLVRAQADGKLPKHATVCIWDRPGYGFSDVLPGADLGTVSLALTSALKEYGTAIFDAASFDTAASKGGHQKSDPKFILVGEGHGGLLTRVFGSAHSSSMAGFVHIEAQTARTYFNENPRGLSTPSLALHRFTARLLPSVLSPLGLARIPSVLFRRSTSLGRILSPGRRGKTLSLNQNTVKARLQETYNSHSHTSGSWRALLRTQTGDKARRYPRDVPAVVISEKGHMDRDEEWKEGQKGLAHQVVGEDGLKGWWVVDNAGKRGVCEGAHGGRCLDAVLEVLK